MQQLGRSINHSAVRHADGLQPETDAEDGQPARVGSDYLDAHPCLLRGSRTWREQNPVEAVRKIGIVEARVVIAPDIDLGANLRQVLHQVVDKRVVVVDDKDLHGGHVIILA